MEGIFSPFSPLQNIANDLLQSKLSLKNNTSPLDESSKAKLKLGLFSYPVLQAADILVHRYVIQFFLLGIRVMLISNRATHVPVGEDQSQHLEFARECVTNFNHAYRGDYLVTPQTILCTNSPLPSPFLLLLTNNPQLPQNV
jgi:tryptophanyl-tRNA synthetase